MHPSIENPHNLLGILHPLIEIPNDTPDLFTCLSVGEDTSVISLKCVIKNVMPKALEDLFLSGKLGVPGIHRIEAMVECEALGLFPAESEKINGLY